MKIKKSMILLFCCSLLCTVPVSAYTTKTTLDVYQNGPCAEAIVEADDLTFRAEPNTNGYVIAVLNSGERLAIIKEEFGSNDNNWLLVIRSDGSVGWVARRYVHIRC